MRLADYVAQFISKVSPRVYGVCGAGAMHLNDALANHDGIRVISMQHEQAAAMAAECDARVTGEIRVVSVTTGPGGTNAITGVACAYVDSIPLLVIAGQVTTATMMGNYKLRQLGMNELDVTALMKPVTKYQMSVTDPAYVRYSLEKAVYLATHGRKGPVFVEIPLDVQAAEIDPDSLEAFSPVECSTPDDLQYLKDKAAEVENLLIQAKRPVIIIGNGIRLAGAIRDFRRAFCHLGVPIVSSWGAADIIPTDHEHYIGRCGIFGDRAANFAVQGADLIIAIGTRLSVAQIGHASELFAKNAKKVVVDIDPAEVYRKPTVKVDVGVVGDAKEFLEQCWFWCQIPSPYAAWLKHCQEMKDRYPPVISHPGWGINSYWFADQLSQHLQPDSVVVTDVGFCFLPIMQSLKLNSSEQRLIHSAGVSPMGWGIPAAIGASFAAPNRQVVCLTGDGGAMLNLQDLQTIAHHQLPIAIFVFENNGYATMKIAQNNHFRREVMSGPRTGMSLPDFVKIAKGFGIYVREFSSQGLLQRSLEDIFEITSQGPMIVVMHMEPGEIIQPRVQAKSENGKFLPADISDMWPHLPRAEYEANMSPATRGSDVVKRFDGIRQEILATN